MATPSFPTHPTLPVVARRPRNSSSGRPTGATGIFPVSYAQTVLATPGLVGFWRLDETTGTTATDLKGTTNGTYTGTFTLAQAGAPLSSPDAATLFDGTSGQVVFNSAPVTTLPFTLECWIHLTSVTQKGLAVKLGTEGPSGGAGGTGAGIGVGNTTMENTGNNLIGIYESVRWVVGPSFGGTGWFHIALVVDGSGVAQFYINGYPVSTPTGATLNAPTAKAYIGGYSGWNGATPAPRFLNDLVDEVAIYNVALSAATILAHYNAR